MLKKILSQVRKSNTDENFLHFTESIEVAVAKILSLAMIWVILVSVCDLLIFLGKTWLSDPEHLFKDSLFIIFGLFLNVLIALEILENITAYLKKHVIQVELVIVTSIIAVARKIIILDLEKTSGVDIIGLGIALLSLSISYWIIRYMNAK